MILALMRCWKCREPCKNNTKTNDHEGTGIFNLGTGQGYSVLEMIAAFSKACGHDLPYQIVGRRPGDLATVYADPAKAKEVLGWTAVKTLDDMCADSWNWQSHNPNGYRD